MNENIQKKKKKRIRKKEILWMKNDRNYIAKAWKPFPKEITII